MRGYVASWIEFTSKAGSVEGIVVVMSSGVDAVFLALSFVFVVRRGDAVEATGAKAV